VDGAVLWRVARSGAQAPQFPAPRSPHLAADADRGVWLAYLYGAAGRPGVAAERIAANGAGGAAPTILVPPGGRALPDALCAGLSPGTDGSGGLVCAYGWRTVGGVRKLSLCRLAPDGGILWGAPQLRSVLGGGLATFSAAALSVSPDGASTLLAGVPVPGTASTYALMAQHFGPDGAPTWGAIPLIVCPAEGRVRGVQALPDGADGTFAVLSFDGTTRGAGVEVLRLGADGRPLWPAPLAVGAAPWAGACFAVCGG
jgi:hypothetical protein